MINEDIDASNVVRSTHRSLKRKFESSNLNDLKSDVSVQQWEGQDFRLGVSSLFVLCNLYVNPGISKEKESFELQFSVIVQTQEENRLFSQQ
jgi:hypothetical protein